MNINEIKHDLVPGNAEIGLYDGWLVTCTFTDDEMNAILAEYDPASATSPAVTACRPIVRKMLDAVLAAQQATP